MHGPRARFARALPSLRTVRARPRLWGSQEAKGTGVTTVSSRGTTPKSANGCSFNASSPRRRTPSIHGPVNRAQSTLRGDSPAWAAPTGGSVRASARVRASVAATTSARLSPPQPASARLGPPRPASARLGPPIVLHVVARLGGVAVNTRRPLDARSTPARTPTRRPLDAHSTPELDPLDRATCGDG